MISQEEAIQIAKKEASLQEWAWEEPVDIGWRRHWIGKNGHWEISTNTASRGPMIRMIIGSKGEVIEKELLRCIR